MKKKTIIISKIISGGQTGADRGGLDAAIAMKIPHGGWCPKDRKAEDGVIPSRYRLKEIKSSFYQERTKKNVVDSDATIVFCFGKASGGSELTVEYARQYKKPVLVIDLDKEEDHAEKISTWLEQRVAARLLADTEKDWTPPMKITLNVAGSRESEAPGIQENVRKIMLLALNS
ncbi:MAG: putative molybdenum carrier protein [Victivallales bacterium]